MAGGATVNSSPLREKGAVRAWCPEVSLGTALYRLSLPHPQILFSGVAQRDLSTVITQSNLPC